MSLDTQITADIKTALKAGEKLKVSTLRLLSAAITNEKIRRKTEDLTDADIMAIIAQQIKARRDAIEAYEKGGRTEAAEKETAEQVILQSYMPEPLTASELETIVRDALRSTGVTDRSGFGVLMQAIMPQVAGRADGKRVSSIVNRLLSAN